MGAVNREGPPGLGFALETYPLCQSGTCTASHGAWFKGEYGINMQKKKEKKRRKLYVNTQFPQCFVQVRKDRKGRECGVQTL
jgi:hypothetical protein